MGHDPVLVIVTGPFERAVAVAAAAEFVTVFWERIEAVTEVASEAPRLTSAAVVVVAAVGGGGVVA